MPKEAAVERADNEFDTAEPVDEGLDADGVLGDDRRPEDEKNKLPVGCGIWLVIDGKMPDNWPVPE